MDRNVCLAAAIDERGKRRAPYGISGISEKHDGLGPRASGHVFDGQGNSLKQRRIAAHRKRGDAGPDL